MAKRMLFVNLSTPKGMRIYKRAWKAFLRAIKKNPKLNTNTFAAKMWLKYALLEEKKKPRPGSRESGRGGRRPR